MQTITAATTNTQLGSLTPWSDKSALPVGEVKLSQPDRADKLSVCVCVERQKLAALCQCLLSSSYASNTDSHSDSCANERTQSVSVDV